MKLSFSQTNVSLCKAGVHKSCMINFVQWHLNSNKTYFLQFLNKKHNEMKIQIMVSNSIITNTTSTKFLGLTMDGTLSWKDHILDLTTKLNKACFAIRPIKSLMYVIKCFENSLLFIFPRINVIWYYILGKLLPL